MTLLAALFPVLALGILGTVVQVPYVAQGPGPTFNTLGEVDGRQVVDIEGTPVDPTSGNLNMTTVSVWDGLNLFEALGLWVSSRYGLVPREAVYPPGRSKEEVQKENDATFRRSEDNAELAALHHLGLPVAVRVARVSEDGPARDVLREGDELVSINGKSVTTVRGVTDVVASAGPGAEVAVVYRRDGVEASSPARLGARPDDAEKGYLGITPEEVPNVPFTVSFNLADVGGPSAGLMFSLAVVDKLSPGELTGGRFVAGTGTIDPDGAVGPIGGIRYKLTAAREAGAATFLVPSRNCDEARQSAPAGLDLIKVDTLDGAVEALAALDSGGSAPHC